MIEKQDKKYVIRLKEDDGVAFEKLFLKYNQKLFNFCFNLTHSKQDAEGIVQQTFLKIWENRHHLNEQKSFSAYIFKISQNLALNKFRSKANKQYYEEYIKEYSHNMEIGVDKLYDYLELKEIIDDLLNKLPERRREIFYLSRNQGLSYKEIASKLGISENTVDTQIRHVLNTLRSALREKIIAPSL